MATKQFALPLNDQSLQTGDITFEKATLNDTDVEFRLTNVPESTQNNAQLNLITRKSDVPVNHIFPAAHASGVCRATLKPDQMNVIFTDANDGDVDYIEANWTTGQADTPIISSMIIMQNGGTYNTYGWPPKMH